MTVGLDLTLTILRSLLTSSYCPAGETRFGTSFFLMERLLTVRDGLEQLMADTEWKAWAGQPKYATSAAATKAVVHDPCFWKAAEHLHSISE